VFDHRPKQLTGFTLLELLVVLSLVSLVVSLVGPASWRQLQAARERGVASDLEAELASLPLKAFQGGDGLEISAQDLRDRLSEPLPDGWSIELDQPLAYGPQGTAKGGHVRLRTGEGVRMQWVVLPLTGEVRRWP